MIFESFDGINAHLSISPRALKVLSAALELAEKNPELVEEVSRQMKIANFDYEPGDVWAIIRQFVLETSPVTSKMNGKGAIPTPEELQAITAPGNNKPN